MAEKKPKPSKTVKAKKAAKVESTRTGKTESKLVKLFFKRGQS